MLGDIVIAYETTAKGGKEPYRSFVHIPGHWHENFSHTAIRTMLLRGIAWAAREPVDRFNALAVPWARIDHSASE